MVEYLKVLRFNNLETLEEKPELSGQQLGRLQGECAVLRDILTLPDQLKKYKLKEQANGTRMA